MLGLGLDIGTSGVRSAVLDPSGAVISTARAPIAEPDQGVMDAEYWWSSAKGCLETQIAALEALGIDPTDIRRAAIDATSGSMVLTDAALVPVGSALMYNSAGFAAEAKVIDALADPGSITRGTGSALGRALRLVSHDRAQRARHLLHQADFVLARLVGHPAGSDDNNALKLGFDPATRRWPGWIAQSGLDPALLPEVVEPGARRFPISPDIAADLGLSPDLMLHAGTTDSIAAFLATGAHRVGDAVTSLGTTLAIKLISDTRVDDPTRGIYSHRLAGRWLTGGASNTGGGVLAQFFSGAEIATHSAKIDPTHPSGLDYYPLTRPGERFPVNDPDLQPRLEPRPDDDVRFLHGMLEGIARIEAHAYAALADLGAPRPRRIFTAGGGAANDVWSAIREARIGVPIISAGDTEASVGAARLALGLVAGRPVP